MFVPAMGWHDVACDFCRKHRIEEPVMFYMYDTGAAICTTCVKGFVGQIARMVHVPKKPVLAIENQPIQFGLNKTPSPNGDST